MANMKQLLKNLIEEESGGSHRIRTGRGPCRSRLNRFDEHLGEFDQQYLYEHRHRAH